MAPPKLFINTKTLKLEKQPENDKEDGYEDFESKNKQEEETEKEDKSDDPETSKDTNGSYANRKERSLSILTNIVSPILVFTGLAIALVGAFLCNNELSYRYFLVVGLHLFSLGWLHFLQAPGTKMEQLLSSLLTRWNNEKPQNASVEGVVHPHHARILICVILCITNVIFTALEIHFSKFLIKKNECYNYGYYGYYGYYYSCYSYGLQTAGLIFSVWLALPWPLLLLWLTNTNTLPCQETFKKLTDMLRREQVQMKDKEDDNDNSDPAEDRNGSDADLTYITSLVFTGLGFALVAAFLWNDDPAYHNFLPFGLHLISIGCLFSVQAMSKFEQIIASFLTRWDNFKQPISGNLANARILISTTLSITNLIFTALEMHILFSSPCYYDHLITTTTVQHGCYVLQTAGLIISICLAFPWPLLVLWLTNGCNKTLPCQKTLRKLTDMLQRKQEQVKKTIVSLLPSLQDPLWSPGANIDQNTVETKVTRSFSQHGIIIGEHLRVLLLDFDGKFTLLIPNIELGKAFRITKADVEVETKELEGEHKRTFMKFTFHLPALEIEAPVLNDQRVGYQMLEQNSACVFLGRMYSIPSGGPGGPGGPQVLEQNGACVFLGRIYSIPSGGPGGQGEPQDQQTVVNMDKNETSEQV